MIEYIANIYKLGNWAVSSTRGGLKSLCDFKLRN